MSTTEIRTESCKCSELLGASLDLVCPTNVKLSAYFKRSHPYLHITMKTPQTINNIMEQLVHNKQEVFKEYGIKGLDDLKNVILEIILLKFEIQTNKAITPLKMHKPNAKWYNIYLKNFLGVNCKCSYFNASWLFVECYIYRRIYEAFLNTKILQEYDFFAQYKRDALTMAIPYASTVGIIVLEFISTSKSNREQLKPQFVELLKLNLCSNKADLAQTFGDISELRKQMSGDFESLQTNLVCDDSDQIYEAICRTTIFEIIDFVMDNAGYELFLDCCLADFFITHKFAGTIRFFVKDCPWFISDTTKSDFDYMLESLANSEDTTLVTLFKRWNMFLEEKTWVIEVSSFWTTYIPFCEMFEKDESLYRKLARSKCTFFKGDLNYRKLLGDINWNPTTPFEEAIEGFYPCRLCSVRTIKCDLICGLREGLVKEMTEKDPEWLLTGTYGTIQYSDKVKRLI